MIILKKYLAAYHHYFWTWEEDGEVIATPDGSTIAYFESIKKIILSFDTSPVPHFGTLLLTNMAMSSHLNDPVENVSTQLRQFISESNEGTGDIDIGDTLKEAIRFLRILRNLPSSYKHGVNRIMVLHALLGQIHNSLSMKESGYILNALQGDTLQQNPEWLIPDNAQFPIWAFVKDFRPLALLSRKFSTEEDLLNYLSSQLDIQEDLAVEEEDAGGTEKGVVALLLEDPKTFQIGALVQRIWSGLNIPYKMSLPSTQPLGGISDLTNKGDFDKLLISEFANDDLVFLSRLANQESLYLRREQPPAADNYERIILIDISIKNWGIPKVMAYATMTAIANHPKTNVRCTAFAIGDDIFELNPYDADQIAKDIGKVEMSLNAALGLEAFLETKKAKRNTEILYISTSESTEFPEMFKLLNDYHFLFKYWINVEPDGNIKVFKNQYQSKRLIQSIKLPLEQLWKNPPKKRVGKRAGEQGLFPMLCPNSYNFIRRFKVGDQCYVISKGGGVLSYDLDRQRKKGLQFLCRIEDFHKSHEYALGTTEDGEVILLNYVPSRKEIRFINCSDFRVESVRFSARKSHGKSGFFFRAGRFFYISGRHRWTFEYEDQWSIRVSHRNDPEQSEAMYEMYWANTEARMHWGSGTVFKNLKSVGVSEKGNLRINNHIFSLDLYERLLLIVDHSQRTAVRAEMETKRRFKFPDGSTIEIAAVGLLIFKSSNPKVETFYIPSFLQNHLAIATDRKFAGDEYFYDESIGNKKTTLTELYEETIVPFVEQITQTA